MKRSHWAVPVILALVIVGAAEAADTINLPAVFLQFSSPSIPPPLSKPGHATMFFDPDAGIKVSMNGFPYAVVGASHDAGPTTSYQSIAESDGGLFLSPNTGVVSVSTELKASKLTANQIVEKSPVANVKAFGAVGDGVTDDTAAIQSALAVSTNVYLPSGTYIVSNLTVVLDKTHIFGDGVGSILKMKAGSTGFILTVGLNRVYIESMAYAGSVATSQKLVASPTGAQNGIRLDAERESFINDVSVYGLSSVGLYFSISGVSDRKSHLTLTNTNIFNNWCGIQDASSTGVIGTAEYIRVASVDVNNNYFGILTTSGNQMFNDIKLTDNGYGIWLEGDNSSNNGHGVLSNSLMNHNTVSIYAHNVTLGYVFSGNNIFEGDVTLDGSNGVNIENGILDASTFHLKGGGINYIRNNYVPNGYGNVITHNYTGATDHTVFVDNYLDNNTWLDNGQSITSAMIANVKSFGAKCDGVTDDTVAIQVALAASTNVYIPSGTCISGPLTVVSDNTLIYGNGPASVIKLKASVSSAALLDGGLHPLSLKNLRISGGPVTGCKTACSTNLSRDGIHMISYKNGSIDGVTIDGFDYRGILFVDAGSTDRLSHYIVTNTTIYQSYIGVYLEANVSEYVRFANVDVNNNTTGIAVSAGNTIISGSKINDNGINIFISGTGISNNAHGAITGSLITHAATYSIYAVDVTLGEAITGNTIIEGTLWLKNSSGINITGGILNVQAYCLDGGGRNVIKDNHVINSLTNTVTHSCNGHVDDTQVVDNSFANGTWLDNGRSLTQATGLAKTGDNYNGTLICGNPDAGVANCLSTATGRDLTLVPALGSLTSITGGIAQAGTGFPQVCPNTGGQVTTAIDCFDGNFAWSKAAGSALTGYLWGNTGPTQLGLHTADTTGQQSVTFLDATNASVAQVGFGNSAAVTANIRNALYIMNYQSNTGWVVLGNYYDVASGNPVLRVQDAMGTAQTDLLIVDGAGLLTTIGGVTSTTGTFSGQVKSNNTNVLTTSSTMWSATMWGGAVYTTIGTNTPLARFKTGAASTVTDVYFTLAYSASVAGVGTGVVALTDTSGVVKCSLNIACVSIGAAYATSGTCGSVALAANTVYELRQTTACTGAGSGFNANVEFAVTTP